MTNLKMFKDVQFGDEFQLLDAETQKPVGITHVKTAAWIHRQVSDDTLVAVIKPVKKKPPRKPATKKPPAAKKPTPVVETPSDLVKVTRSFSFKMNLGNYQSVDFFCSQTVECKDVDAEAKSAQVVAFCKAQVQKDIADFKANRSAFP